MVIILKKFFISYYSVFIHQNFPYTILGVISRMFIKKYFIILSTVLLCFNTVSANPIPPPTVSQVTIEIHVFIEGFYNTPCNCTVSDTVQVLLYFQGQSESQWLKQTGILDEGGYVTVTFSNVPSDNFFLGIKHKNSMRTWSSVLMAPSAAMTYDFTMSQSTAFGNNLVKMSNNKCCLYSGDVDKNGFIDSNDLMLIVNDFDGTGNGPMPTDITGDGTVDESDMELCYNNTLKHVREYRPTSLDFIVPVTGD